MGTAIIDGRGTGDITGVTSGNRLMVDEGSSVRNYLVEVGLGNIPGAESRAVFGAGALVEGEANQRVFGSGFTTRYQFPTAAAQMTIVSTDTNDTLLGTGTQVVLVIGLLADKTELQESVLMNGTSGVTTVASFLRVNSILSVSVGSGKKNAGTITVKNVTDLLAQMQPGFNLSQVSAFTVRSGATAIIMRSDTYPSKDDAVITTPHIFSAALGGIDLTILSQEMYQNQVGFGFFVYTDVAGGTDIEVTGFSKVNNGSTIASTIFELLIQDD